MFLRLTQHLTSLFQAHLEVAQSLPAGAFSRKLPCPSDTIGHQFWCIIGARESYTRALEAGEWAGFACSLAKDETSNQQKVIEALTASQKQAEAVLGQITDWTPERNNTLVDLLEHESQHQGQLIRYVYGLGYEFPQSWKDRWHL